MQVLWCFRCPVWPRRLSQKLGVPGIMPSKSPASPSTTTAVLIAASSSQLLSIISQDDWKRFVYDETR